MMPKEKRCPLWRVHIELTHLAYPYEALLRGTVPQFPGYLGEPPRKRV